MHVKMVEYYRKYNLPPLAIVWKSVDVAGCGFGGGVGKGFLTCSATAITFGFGFSAAAINLGFGFSKTTTGFGTAFGLSGFAFFVDVAVAVVDSYLGISDLSKDSSDCVELLIDVTSLVFFAADSDFVLTGFVDRPEQPNVVE